MSLLSPISLLMLLVVCTSVASCKQKTNRLETATSPYLQQHADNPVDWYEWGEEALQKAKKENKPLLISVGFASCHWCHVMEKESFMDTAVARLMNENFVCIKVDREQRPDIDQIYMNACQLISGNSGWPLNAFALPDGKPFHAGTYYSKKSWTNLLKQVSTAYKLQPGKIALQASSLTNGIAKLELDLVAGDADSIDIQPDYYQLLIDSLYAKVDPVNGGLRGEPKFPMPAMLELLLQHAAISGDSLALNLATNSLTRMALGGIYDQAGGGFARYAVDSAWHVPHFEKMLYDNAQLISVYAHAYQLTADPFYKTILEETLAFVNRELNAGNGGYFSSLNADVKAGEGAYYTWTFDELKKATGSDALCQYFGVKAGGNFTADEATRSDMSKNGDDLNGNRDNVSSNVDDLSRSVGDLSRSGDDLSSNVDNATKRGKDISSNLSDGRSGENRPGNNVLHAASTPTVFAAKMNIPPGEFIKQLKSAKQNMLQAKKKREAPAVDRKILASWNALMLSALADAYVALQDKAILDQAKKTALFLEQNFLQQDGSLLRNFTGGSPSIDGMLEDYAMIAKAYIRLYQVTFDKNWLTLAQQLSKYAIDHFYDPESGMFYNTSAKGQYAVVRKLSLVDESMPSANAVMAEVLYLLGLYFDQPDYLDKSKVMVAKTWRQVSRTVPYMSYWAILVGLQVYGINEIVIIGTDALARNLEMQKHYLPQNLYLGAPAQENLPLMSGKLVKDKTYIYACIYRTCKKPVESVREAIIQIESRRESVK